MKKYLYYITPFVVYPLLILGLDLLLEKIRYIGNLTNWFHVVFILLMILASVVISLFNNSGKKFDIPIVICNLVAFVAAMAVVTWIDTLRDDHYDFSIRPFYQPYFLLIYLLIFCSGLAASYGKFRWKTKRMFPKADELNQV